jgi:hypothetical protein
LENAFAVDVANGGLASPKILMEETFATDVELLYPVES